MGGHGGTGSLRILGHCQSKMPQAGPAGPSARDKSSGTQARPARASTAGELGDGCMLEVKRVQRVAKGTGVTGTDGKSKV